MIKIGILGSDNSHAGEFSHLANKPFNGKMLYDDVRVTHIYGHNSEETEKLVKEYDIPNVVTDPAQMLGQIDAAMVVFRDGIHHFKYAKPFVERGLPIWIDKPITITTKECEQLFALAKKHNSLLTGGSNCKFAAQLKEAREYVSSKEKGKIKSAILNFPIHLDSVYSGMHFYAAHLVEMMTEVFGFDVKHVYAHISGEVVNAICEYDGLDVHLCYAPNARQYSCFIIEEGKVNPHYDIKIGDIAERAFEDFVTTIKTKKTSYPSENLLITTKIVNAIDTSMKIKKRIKV